MSACIPECHTSEPYIHTQHDVGTLQLFHQEPIVSLTLAVSAASCVRCSLMFEHMMGSKVALCPT